MIRPLAPVAPSVARKHSTVLTFVEALRPSQWTKNGFVFAALIFSRSLTNWHRSLLVTEAAVIFSIASSATYLLNDVLDVAEDRQHPAKCLRPVASGRLSRGVAVAAGAVLELLALAAAWRINHQFFAVVAAYAALSLCYSAWLKKVVLLDVFMVAAGFVLRVLAGGVVIHVEISAWLVACTTLLALFIALSKRRHELVLLGDQAEGHRANLVHYSPYFLDQLIAIVTASTVMSYVLYTLSADVHARFPGKRLELTTPFVLFGIFRYLYLVHRRERGGDPTRLLFTDPALLLVVLFWAASVVGLIYF